MVLFNWPAERMAAPTGSQTGNESEVPGGTLRNDRKLEGLRLEGGAGPDQLLQDQLLLQGPNGPTAPPGSQLDIQP